MSSKAWNATRFRDEVKGTEILFVNGQKLQVEGELDTTVDNLECAV